MKLRNFLYILSLGTLVACGDSPTLNNTPPTNNPTPGPIETDYYVSPASTECRTEVTGEKWSGLENILGCGYDITGSYMSVSSMRGRVIDLDKLDPGRLVVLSALASSTGVTFSGSDRTAFLSDLMANAGIEHVPSKSDLCFTGTLPATSGNSTTLMHVSWHRKLSGQIAAFPYVFLPALSAGFADDVRYMRAKNIVDRYGTHFFVHANVGVSVKTIYSAYIDADDNGKIKLAQKGFEAAESALAGKLGPDLTLTLAGLNNYGASLIKVFNGGDTDLIDYNSQTGILCDYSAWIDSGDKSNYGLTDNISAGDLLPISEAIDDPELKKEVEAEIERRIYASQHAENSTVPLLQNTNGRIYRYVTGYDESLRLENEDGLISFGVLGSLYINQADGALPLYTNIDSTGSQILSLIQPDDSWTIMGYVMQSRSLNTISLYEIYDGSRYAYTIEAANSYGPRNEWHPTGAVFYLLRP